MFEFADIDRDGMVDMLFITDRNTMNFIVNYNMLDSPAEIAEIKKHESKSYTKEEAEQTTVNQLENSI